MKRRWRYLVLDVDAFVALCRYNGRRPPGLTAALPPVHMLIPVDPLPYDARVVRVGVDPMGVVNIIVESDAFAELGEAEMPPRHDVKFSLETL